MYSPQSQNQPLALVVNGSRMCYVGRVSKVNMAPSPCVTRLEDLLSPNKYTSAQGSRHLAVIQSARKRRGGGGGSGLLAPSGMNLDGDHSFVRVALHDTRPEGCLLGGMAADVVPRSPLPRMAACFGFVILFFPIGRWQSPRAQGRGSRVKSRGQSSEAMGEGHDPRASLDLVPLW